MVVAMQRRRLLSRGDWVAEAVVSIGTVVVPDAREVKVFPDREPPRPARAA